MTTRTTTFPLHAAAGTAPRTPRWREIGRSLWRFAESIGRARAAAHLHRLAVLRAGTNPELASRLRETAGRIEGTTA